MTTIEAGPDRYDAGMLIAGETVHRADRLTVSNPARSFETVGSVPAGTPVDVERATRAAQDAFETWRRVPLQERARILRSAGGRILDGATDRAKLLTRESGQLLSEATGGVRGCARVFEYYAEVGDAYQTVDELPSPNGRVNVVKQPMGVAALIVPWNAPTYLAALGIAPILLAGNTLVVKPPTAAPLALIDMLTAIADLFPSGTINIVTGSGEEIGAALVSDARVRKVNFTGSSEAGKAVLRSAAATVKRVSLELGGNDPAIVLRDADLDYTVPELVPAVYSMSGQVCYNVKRIYVDREIAGEFIDRFHAIVDGFAVGDGLAAGSSMGPMINAAQRSRVEDLVDDAERRGARVIRAGRALDPDHWSEGHFLLPTILTNVGQDVEIVRCEQFGPAIPIIPFDDEDEAIRLANDTEFGLGSSIWTQDEEHGFALADQIEAGSTFINVHRKGSGVDMPFGGFKESGLGRGHGVVALDEQFELHTISSRRPA